MSIGFTMFTFKNLFKPNDWNPIWHKRDTVRFAYRRRDLSTGNIDASWDRDVDVLIEILYSKSRNDYKLHYDTEDAKYSKAYSEAIEKINELRGIKID